MTEFYEVLGKYINNIVGPVKYLPIRALQYSLHEGKKIMLFWKKQENLLSSRRVLPEVRLLLLTQCF